MMYIYKPLLLLCLTDLDLNLHGKANSSDTAVGAVVVAKPVAEDELKNIKVARAHSISSWV